MSGHEGQRKPLEEQLAELPDLLLPSEVAKVLNVDRQSVTRWAQRGRLAHIRTPGGEYRIHRSAVAALLAGDHETTELRE